MQMIHRPDGGFPMRLSAESLKTLRGGAGHRGKHMLGRMVIVVEVADRSNVLARVGVPAGSVRSLQTRSSP
jgi:hypothetical protein